jgi:hypothetical protein
MKMSQQLTTLTIPYESLGKKESKKADFETALRESIDEVFSAFGKNVKQAIYSLLENNYNISKKDIPNKAEAFTNALEATFGEPAKLIEIKIIEKLQVKIKDFTYRTGKSDLLLTDYLTALRSHRF